MPQHKKTGFIYNLAKVGAIAIGVVYVLIGVVAMLSLLQVREGGADESSILNLLQRIPLGEVVVGAIFLGLLAYIVWKFYNAIKDPYGYGHDLKGVGKRLGMASAGLAYGLIAYSAIQAMFNLASGTHGQPTEQRLMVTEVFTWGAGEWMVGVFGALVAFTGLAQFVYVIKKGYREKIHVSNISKNKKRVVATLAWIGHFARGIILLIISYFLIQAAIQSDASDVVNTDKAFDFLGDHIGKLSFILVAFGTICYGFYMFALSMYYDFHDDF